MKKLRFGILLLTASVLAGSVPTGAVSFSSLDRNTAVAGVSASLRNFYESNENAQEMLQEYFKIEEEPEETQPTEDAQNTSLVYFSEYKTGTVIAGSVLNVREQPSASSAMIAALLKDEKVLVIARQVVNGALWYEVEIDDFNGFVMANYVALEKTDEEAETTVPTSEQTASENPENPNPEGSDPASQAPAMPESFNLPGDAGSAGEAVYNELMNYRNEINYCLTVDYPNFKEAGNTLNLYSLLVYILENYQHVSELASQYNMTRTFSLAESDIAKVEANRAYLSEITGQTEEEFFEEIIENDEAVKKAQEEAAAAEEAARIAAEEAEAARAAAEAAAEAEARRQAEEAAAAAEAARVAAEEAARAAAEEAQRIAKQATDDAVAVARTEGEGTLGREIANKAEEYVGWLPYVWGGSSLENGADCSGFIAQILAGFGILDQNAANHHAYDSYSLRSVGREVSLAEIMPGDIVCYDGHVGIYFGNGIIVHEPRVGMNCGYASINLKPIVCIRRVF